MSPPATTLISTLCAGSTIFALGFAWAVMKRANSDYKKTKAVLPSLRKDFWRAVGAVFKAGMIIAVAVLALAAWAVYAKG